MFSELAIRKSRSFFDEIFIQGFELLISHRIALKPNNKQETYFNRASGVARFAYNWALDEWKRQYAESTKDASLPKPSQASIGRRLNAIKREKFPWMLEVTKNAPQMAIIQLGAAFKNFFSGRSRFPKFRKKGVHDRFSLTNDQFKIDGSRIRIPMLGWVRMQESLRFNGKIMSATVSRVADRWFVSITVDTNEDHNHTKAKNQGVVGVDLGVAALATLSTGEAISGPKPYKALFSRVQRLSRGLSRKRKGSSNRIKAKTKLARLHARIAAIRSNSLHQLTSNLTSRFHTIGIEDLNVGGLVRNRRLSRSISDMGFYEFRRQLQYKAQMRGSEIVVVSRFYPSSKTCSCCGFKLESLPLSVREWVCPDCGSLHDRDVNAAVNLKNMAVSSTASACGEGGSGLGRKAKAKPSSEKQELSFAPI